MNKQDKIKKHLKNIINHLTEEEKKVGWNMFVLDMWTKSQLEKNKDCDKLIDKHIEED